MVSGTAFPSVKVSSLGQKGEFTVSELRRIDIDFDVHQVIVANQTGFDETPNAVLRRLLGLQRTGTEPPQRPIAPDPDEPGPPTAEVRGDQPRAGSIADRSRGLMVGIAVGNLLGLPYEGRRWNRAAIAAEFPGGVREIAAKPGWPDDDDLAQSIILAEAGIAADAYDIGDLAHRMWAWAETNGAGMGSQTGHVLRLFGGTDPRRELRQYARYGTVPTGRPPRPPSGHTAIDAARIAWEERGSTAAGNGAAMRCAPVALRWTDDEVAVARNSVVSAAVTHWDPRCLWSTVLINLAIVRCLRGEIVDPDELMATADDLGHRLPDELAPYRLGGRMPTEVRDSALAALDRGTTVDRLNIDYPNSGYTLNTMRAALWSARHPANFEDGLSAVVSIGGDTDTNGAIAGAVLGARFGHQAIPARWRDAVAAIRDHVPPVANWPPRERLEALADRLLASRQTVPTPKVAQPHPKGTLRIQGATFRYRNAKEALCIVLRQLQKADSSFLGRLSRDPRCIGRKRRTLARRPEDLYPNRPDLQAEQCVRVADGWFVGTNTNTPQKATIIRVAADVAGLKFGEDVVVEF